MTRHIFNFSRRPSVSIVFASSLQLPYLIIEPVSHWFHSLENHFISLWTYINLTRGDRDKKEKTFPFLLYTRKKSKDRPLRTILVLFFVKTLPSNIKLHTVPNFRWDFLKLQNSVYLWKITNNSPEKNTVWCFNFVLFTGRFWTIIRPSSWCEAGKKVEK